MTKKRNCWAFLILLAMLIPLQNALGAGGTVDSGTLRMTLPYVQYLGTPYYVTLDYDANKSGAAGLFWRFNSIAPSSLQGQCGGTVDPSSLNISNLCVLFAGMQFQVTLEFQSADATWKLGGGISQLPGMIASVSGSCYDSPEDILNDPMFQCLINCGDDLDCLTGCIGGAFELGITFNNPTTSPIDFLLPPGMTFVPDGGDVQTMMALCEGPITLPPGTSKHCLTVYCMNSSLGAPGLENVYSPSGGVNRPCLIETLNLTRCKSLNAQQIQRIQTIIWDCIDQGAISSQDRQFLEGL